MVRPGCDHKIGAGNGLFGGVGDGGGGMLFYIKNLCIFLL